MVLILPVLASLCPLATPQAPKSAPPPGMVTIPGGMTWVGTDRAELEKAAEENVTRFKNLANETPQFQKQVDAFHLGVTEVTNEQFAEFVHATGARPPDAWGMKAIDEAAQQYALEVGKARNAAREAGKPMPELPTFDQVQWWNEHWREAKWQIPEGQETLPAGYIDYGEALAYARWAGVRLMTEFEFQRAGRGSSKSAYPWGDKWDSSLCANGGLGLKSAKPVGSYPGGKSAQGVYDLSGNMWEWTSSPFVEYPGFKVIQVKRRDETIDALVAWNASQRVVVSGSYATESPSAARLSTRRPTDPDQSAEAVGFRIAASTHPGTDIAATVLGQAQSAVATTVAFDEHKAVICDRWRTKPGKSKVPGYSVIAGYDYVVFVPAVGLDYTSLGQLEHASLDRGPIDVGVLATNQELLEPALPAGIYTLALRAAGPLHDHESTGARAEAPAKQKHQLRNQDPKQKAAPAPVVYPEGFPVGQRNLMFLDRERRVVGWVELERAEFVVPARTSVEIGTAKRERVEGGKPSQVEVSTVVLHVTTWVKVANKGLGYSIPLAFAAGAVTPDWRH